MNTITWITSVLLISGIFYFVIHTFLAHTELNSKRFSEDKIRIGNLLVKKGVTGCNECIYYAGMGECRVGGSIKPCTKILIENKITCVIVEES